MNDIEQKWKDYRFSVIPLDAPQVQTIESRRAYYAGAAAVIKMALHLAGQSQQQAAKQMHELRKECERFQADVVAGRA